MRLAMLLIPALMILHDNAKKVIPVIDLTQAHTRETAIGVPGLSVSAISGEGISPGYSSLNIRVTLLRISTQAQSAVLEMQLRNIANSDVDIPLSTDQAAVQKAGTKHRITMDFMLVQAGRESQLGSDCQGFVWLKFRERIYLHPQAERLYRLKGAIGSTIRKLQVGFSYRLGVSSWQLFDDRFHISSRTARVLSANDEQPY